ncbi:ABC transporter permease [Rosistilla oblonga]|uniref:ABC transporter permease n=1 Tax=Rosistilla oblonga TaxID=2527990 RepID=UPI003A98108F
MTNLRFLFKLVSSQLRRHPGRAVITTLGVIASTCAVVWVASGYDALVSQFDENAGKYLGRYDVLVMAKPAGPPGASTPPIPPALIDELEQDAGVMEVNPTSNYRVTATRVANASADEEDTSPLGLLIGSRPPVNGAPPIGPKLVSTPAAEAPYDMVDGVWLDDDDQANAVVVAEQVAKKLKVGVGDEILVTSFGNQVKLTVIGIVEQVDLAPSLNAPGGRGKRSGAGRGEKGEGGPGRGGDASAKLAGGKANGPVGPGGRDGKANPKADGSQIQLPTGFGSGIATDALYVRPAVAAKVNGYEPTPEVLQVALRDTVTVAQFRQAWQARFASHRPAMQLIDFEAVRGGMESSRSVSGQQSQAWAATGMASLAAIFIIFSTLSMGVSERAREFAMLRAVALTRSQIAGIIAIESIVLAMIGWGGGLLAGWLMVLVGSRLLPGLFSSGAVLGWGCVLLTGVTVLVGALGAAIVPAWRAMRIQPLDAMSPRTASPRFHGWIVLSIIGLVMVTATPITVFAMPLSDEARKWCYAFVTYPLLLVGMILLAPAVVVLCERIFAPLVTRLLRLDQRMMKTQLASNLWRSVGATLALSVGLGLFASTQTWGYSMLVPFTPGDWMPDALVAFHPVGLSEQAESLVAEVDGVKADDVMPLAIEQAKFDWGDVGPPKRLRMGGDNGIVFGLDPRAAFGGEHPLADVQFVAGDRDSAIELLADGKHCVLPEDFAMASRLGIGDTVTLIPPAAEKERVRYEIAGIVSLPGWQWMTKFSGVRRHFVRTGTLLFTDRSAVKTDFHLPRTEFFWVNFEPGQDLKTMETRFQAIAEEQTGETFQATGVGEVKSYRPFARMTATETVRTAIRKHADGMIWGMSYMPLITLVVMSLAVANTIITSVRSRTWEFGVMRSIGVTRGQLIRLVIAETVLIALAACLLSLTFGLIAGWCGVGMAQFGGWFAGPPSFRIPWSQLGFGFGLTLILCLLAGLWPAMRTGRAEPLALLQAGRATQ